MATWNIEVDVPYVLAGSNHDATEFTYYPSGCFKGPYSYEIRNSNDELYLIHSEGEILLGSSWHQYTLLGFTVRQIQQCEEESTGGEEPTNEGDSTGGGEEPTNGGESTGGEDSTGEGDSTGGEEENCCKELRERIKLIESNQQEFNQKIDDIERYINALDQIGKQLNSVFRLFANTFSIFK